MLKVRETILQEKEHIIYQERQAAWGGCGIILGIARIHVDKALSNFI